MSGWFNKVRKDMSCIVDVIDHFEKELMDARKDISMTGNLEKISRDMPGVVEYRFNQLQEIEAILEYINIQLRKVRGDKFRKYLENYNKALSAREAEKYADADSDVINMSHIVNEFAMIRNKYLGLMKAIDAKQFQINNVVKLRTAGMEDIIL